MEKLHQFTSAMTLILDQKDRKISDLERKLEKSENKLQKIIENKIKEASKIEHRIYSVVYVENEKLCVLRGPMFETSVIPFLAETFEFSPYCAVSSDEFQEMIVKVCSCGFDYDNKKYFLVLNRFQIDNPFEEPTKDDRIEKSFRFVAKKLISSSTSDPEIEEVEEEEAIEDEEVEVEEEETIADDEVEEKDEVKEVKKEIPGVQDGHFRNAERINIIKNVFNLTVNKTGNLWNSHTGLVFRELWLKGERVQIVCIGYQSEDSTFCDDPLHSVYVLNNFYKDRLDKLNKKSIPFSIRTLTEVKDKLSGLTRGMFKNQQLFEPDE